MVEAVIHFRSLKVRQNLTNRKNPLLILVPNLNTCNIESFRLAGYDEMSNDLLKLRLSTAHHFWFENDEMQLSWNVAAARFKIANEFFYRNFAIAIIARSHAFYTVKLIKECNYLRPTSKYSYTETDTFNSHIWTGRQISNDLQCCWSFFLRQFNNSIISKSNHILKL